MPIACHDDNITDEERAIVNEKISEILNNLDKYQNVKLNTEYK